MSRVEHDRRIDYIEFPATDIVATKHFYSEVFGWIFEDYGPSYTSFKDGHLSGGFWMSSKVAAAGHGPLIVIYALDLHDLLNRVEAAGGMVIKAPFDFPGGRRFEFSDPNGNVLAVWSES